MEAEAATVVDATVDLGKCSMQSVQIADKHAKCHSIQCQASQFIARIASRTTGHNAAKF